MRGQGLTQTLRLAHGMQSPVAASLVPQPPRRALRPVPAQFTTQGVWMVPWAVSTAYTLFTPKSSVLTWIPVTGQFSMIWWQREGSRVREKPWDVPVHLTSTSQIWERWIQAEIWHWPPPFSQQLLLLPLVITSLPQPWAQTAAPCTHSYRDVHYLHAHELSNAPRMGW